MAIMELINDALRFKDTVFYKESSDLQDRYDALSKLNSEYPNNDILKNEMYCIKKECTRLGGAFFALNPYFIWVY